MGRPEKPIDPRSGPLAEFAAALRELRAEAGLTYRQLAQRAHYAAGALSEAASGVSRPTWEATSAFVRGCGGDPKEWRSRWEAAALEPIGRRTQAPASEPAGAASGVDGTGDPAHLGNEDSGGSALDSVTDPQGFQRALLAQKVLAGNPSLRALCALARRHGYSLARTTLSEALKSGERVPSWQTTEAFLAACGVPAEEIKSWRSVWERVKFDHRHDVGEPSDRWRDACPYPGLASFTPADAEVFYGRETVSAQLVEQLSSRLAGPSVLVVTGSSGAGKSSLLGAGLLPAIDRGALGAEARRWPRLLITPGQEPLRELAAAFARFTTVSPRALQQTMADDPDRAHELLRSILVSGAPDGRGDKASGHRRVILVVDQFEEIFTHAAPEDRDTFVRALRSVASAHDDTDPPAVVVLGVRADFLADCAACLPLWDALRSGIFVVGPMTRTGIRRAITGPAAVAGLTLEPGLVDLILSDVVSTASAGDMATAALPLLSHALRRTWQHREGDTLTIAAYKTTTGLTGSIASHAEEVYQRLSPGQRSAAQALLCAMVAVTHDQRVIRRSIDLHTLDLSDPDSDLSTALEALIDGRLIVVGEDTAGLTHEALLRAWPRLAKWIKENIEQIRVQAQLHHDATVWALNDGDPAYLYRGTRLELAQAGISQPESDLTARFLRASQRAHRRRRNLIRATAAALVVLTAISISSAIAAQQARILAVEQRDAAISARIAVALQNVTDPTLSALLAAAAWRIAPGNAARDALATAALGLDKVVIAATAAQSLALTPDGTRLATGGTDGTVRLWETATQRSLGTFAVHTKNITAVAFSPDGSLLATGGTDGTARLWDPAARKSIATLTGHVGPVLSVAFSPDGSLLATGGSDGTVRLWDVTTHRQLGAPLTGHADRVNSVAFSPDGTRLATGSADGTVRLWDTLAHRPIVILTGHVGPVLSVAFSPDGTRLATGSTDNTVRLWDTVTGRAIGLPGPFSGNGIDQVAFSPDGRFLGIVGRGPTGQANTLQLVSLPDSTSATRLLDTICTEAGRDLTPAEWATYIPELPYQRTCPA